MFWRWVYLIMPTLSLSWPYQFVCWLLHIILYFYRFRVQRTHRAPNNLNICGNFFGRYKLYKSIHLAIFLLVKFSLTPLKVGTYKTNFLSAFSALFAFVLIVVLLVLRIRKCMRQTAGEESAESAAIIDTSTQQFLN